MQTEPVTYWSCHDTELFEGKFTSQIFPWHFHQAYTVIIILEGSVKYTFQDESIHVRKGEVFIVNPFEAHFNEGLEKTGWTYKVFFLSPSIFNVHDSEKYQAFERQVINRKELTEQLLNFHAMLKETISINRHDEIIANLSEQLIKYFPSKIKAKNINRKVLPALIYVNTHLAEKISNEELARLCLVSKYYFQRLFKSCTGLTVRDYIHQQRMETSRQLLRDDAKSGDVAYSTGYFDQSHFHHQFKKMWGLTPKEFSR